VGQSGHSVAEAVSELVDNALDARVDGHVRVIVEYDVRDGWIRVSDDGGGMNRQELANALVLGLSTKGAADIGRFGLGLKTAAGSLGSRFHVTTVRPEATFEWIAEYDEADFLRSGRWELPIRRRAKQRDRGTVVQVWSNRVYPALYQSLERNLGSTFRHFVRDGVLDLAINGNPVQPASYDLDPASVMPFEGEVAGRRVHGWAGLLLKSSQRGWYGLSLVRNRRIVRQHEKLGYQPHPSLARVVGELHLDEFDTNNLKTDFIRETAEWRELEKWVSHTIEPILAASRRLAHAGLLDLRIRSRIEEQRSDIFGRSDDHHALEFAGGGVGQLEEESLFVSVAVGPLHLQHRWVKAASSDDYMTVEREARAGESDVLVVQSNLTHELGALIPDRGLWACHNLAEAAARSLAPAEQFTQLKGIVLASLLGQPDLLRALAQDGAARVGVPS
jgi:hypothetical protein